MANARPSAMLTLVVALICLVSLRPTFASHADLVRFMGPQAVNLWRLDAAEATRCSTETPAALYLQDSDQRPLHEEMDSDRPVPEFSAYWFIQPLDHFSNSTHQFRQRYWINTRHYRPGTNAPVIVLDGGETSGEDRLPFLDTGIVEILANATGGVGVVLEHRYYGRSLPVMDLSTDNLRWLNNAQAAADSANFMMNVKFPGIDEDLTAPGHPWIYYGGSYAGARAAHMKILYPNLVFGAIASSAVTHATLENWEYMDIIRRAANPECSHNLEIAIEAIDRTLSIPVLGGHLKGLFGLAELEHDEDFVSLIESPLGAWQAKNWNPEVGSTRFEEFCDTLNEPIFGSPGLSGEQMITFESGLSVPLVVYNYAKYIKENVVSRCPEGMSVEDCFGTWDDTKFQDVSTSETWRLWAFQVCTEWGYFFTAPPKHHPRIVSRLLTLDYEAKICQQAYPPGKYFVVPHLPNVTVVNELGDFDTAADRLAIIDGEVDPWRPNTPHSEYASDREDTILRPFKLIPNGVHHYDEFGLRNMFDEPPEILQIHKEMIEFVTEWLKDWKAPEQSEYS
ncbi:peptidase S28 [Obba rivulosa]|uniref:Peptidase S28 n=1 Tax=Obba rivulosa TaxID=1052685 RepID=A0A8E2B014_9APHY|nr:peptidase S28 [Obba rivulosa]